MICRGGNRSGKSIFGAVFVASAARRMPIVGVDGRPFPPVAPTDRPLLIWVIGKGEDHIGDTLHRLLFAPDQVPILRDPETGEIRAARDFRERELGISQGMKCSPLVPPDEIESKNWVDKGAQRFSHVRLKNGTTIAAFTSTGDVKMGDPVDLIWIDEDLKYPKYVAEWQARLSDRKGRLLWTAWPWASNYALVEMSERAKRDAIERSDNPDVVEVVLTFSENPFIDPEEKRKRRTAWSFSGDAEVRSRDEGDFMTDLVLMYPNFSKIVHGVGREGMAPDRLEQELAKTAHVPPPHWTHRLFLDPGHSYTGILFVATPPPEVGDYVVVYDELYLRGYDAQMCAKAVKQRLSGRVFWEFVIDGRIARETAVGIGKTYYQIYANAFAEVGLRSVVNAAGFTISSDDVSTGILAVRNWLAIRSDGTPKLRVVTSAVPNFCQEITIYRKAVTREETQEKPAGGQRDHLMDDLRYAAMHGCEYFEPPDLSAVLPESGVYRAFREWRQTPEPPAEQPTFHCGAGSLSARTAASSTLA
jgi:hypothetical protein